ncbi:MAG: glycoside hydrolase family 28 protein [Lachnospiraceae bacterium]
MTKRDFDVREYGAIGDGKTVNTEAIQKALDECHAQGGGYVVLSQGEYVTGTLYMRSNVWIKIEVSARMVASPSIADYGTETHYNRYVNEPELDRCFLYGENCTNIGLVGEGEINGNAPAFPNEGDIYRPMMLRLLNCTNIHLQGLRLIDSAGWTCAFLDCHDIWADGLYIHAMKRYNGDGLDFDGCQNVYVSNCTFYDSDDCLCLQASSKEYPVENIHVTNCRFTGICAAIRIGLKSIGDIRDVVISNCTMRDVWREGIKIECTEGGIISDISISNMVMHNVTRPIFVILNNRLDVIGSSVGLEEMPLIGEMARIHISDLIAVDDDEMKNTHWRFGDDIMGEPKFNGIRIDAEENHPIKDVVLRNIHYRAIGGVKLSDIPKEYPIVKDMRFFQGEKVSENYYPDWSRVHFMDIRNVKRLSCSDILFETVYSDERPSYILEGCDCLKEDIVVISEA